VSNGATIIGHPAIPLRHPVHRALRLHLLARADGIAFLQELRERRAGAVRNRNLKLFRKVDESHIRVNGLDIAQKLVGKTTRPLLQRGDSIEHSREQDRLHDIVGGSLHVP
jgi:hypothetical protein